MNDYLTQKFLSLKWDKQLTKTLNTSSVSDDSILSLIDSIFQEWSCETTNMISVNNQLVVSVNLYLPGRILSGVGSSTENALANIVRNIFYTDSVNDIINETSNNVNVQKVENTTQVVNQQIETPESVVQKINEMANNVQPKQPNPIDSLMMDFPNIAQQQQTEQPITNQPIEVEIGSEEEKKISAEFQQFGTVGINEPIIQPTAQEVNPTNQPMTHLWNEENGPKLKNWMNSHGINNPEQISAWFRRFCGLDYEHFNPAYIDQFLKWADSLRESQTY